MKKKSLKGYTCESIKNALTRCHGGVDAVDIDRCCAPGWKKKYCDGRNGEPGRCERFFPDGTYNQEIMLKKLMNKPNIKFEQVLAPRSKEDMISWFEEEAYKKCRCVKITIEEA